MAVVATRLAVLIDADNASASVTHELMAEIAKYGTPTIRRAYGDWTTQNLAGWKDHLLRHAIQPIQQFAYTRGKNATDSSLIIDAMDVLYADNVEGFAIVSSDSDFTRLATRLRESGKTVYGLGRRETPEAFVKACDRFIYLELLGPERERVKPPDLKPLLQAAIEGTGKVDGWSHLAEVGAYLSARNPGFDVRAYDASKLGELVRRQKYVEVREVGSPPGPSVLHVRLRSGQSR
jgi:NYN domain-containing protein/OST-HTH/LOTUS domain-containing protein